MQVQSHADGREDTVAFTKWKLPMKKTKKSSSAGSRSQDLASKIEGEEFALVMSIREAEEQLRRLNRDSIGFTESGIEAEREAWAVKTNYYRNKLKLVRESLDRLRSGKLGVCASCGEEISERRLKALPTAIYCLECQQDFEQARTGASLSL